MFAAEIRRAIEAAPRQALPQIAAAMWKAFGAGQITEAETEELAALIEVRTAVASDRAQAARRSVGSRPRSAASLERRRRWVASSRMPPAIAAKFTMGEAAALAVVASEVARHGSCRLTAQHIAALAGVGVTTVRNAIRQARKLELITVEERKVAAWRNLANVVRIISPEWSVWLRIGARGGGIKTLAPTANQESQETDAASGIRSKGAAGGQSRARAAPPRDSRASPSIRGRAMP